MKLDVVNAQNEKVDTLDLRDEVFGGRVNGSVLWEAVTHQNAVERRGTHATRNRGRVSGSGRKPWRQKGTGRARVGEIRNPLWRKGGTVFGPQPRSYAYGLPRKVTRAALRAALAQKLRDGTVTVIDQLALAERKTAEAAELLQRLGGIGGTLIVDVRPDETFVLATRNLTGVRVVASGRLTARDVLGASRIIASRSALERLQEVLVSRRVTADDGRSRKDTESQEAS